jgi:hypothetical protein
MQKTLNEALAGLNKLGAKEGLPATEKEFVRLLTTALQTLDERLVALEGTNQAPSAPIRDTPQGETAPLSR